jgi:pimeloyl-ACP methyl ester carboxylesterase
MPVSQVNGLALHTQVLGVGQAPPAAMLHGLLVGSLTSWYFGAAPRLARTHRVLMFDLRGHGRSAPASDGYDVETLSRDLEALLDDFDPRPVMLVGHSYGALAALRFTLRRPDRVAKLALVEAPLPPASLAELKEFIARTPGQMADSLPEELRTALASGGRRAAGLMRQLGALSQSSLLHDLAAETDIPDEVLAQIQCPTLLLYGHSSSCLPVGERLARTIPDARLEILLGGHFLPSEAPGQVSEALVRFANG